MYVARCTHVCAAHGCFERQASTRHVANLVTVTSTHHRLKCSILDSVGCGAVEHTPRGQMAAENNTEAPPPTALPRRYTDTDILPHSSPRAAVNRRRFSHRSRSPGEPEWPLRLIIIGHNPSEKAWELGHYYGNPSNRMWKLLSSAGIIPPGFTASNDEDCPITSGVGFTDVVCILIYCRERMVGSARCVESPSFIPRRR